jgi:hypothetical protein
MTPARKLTYMFLTLPYVHQLEVAKELGFEVKGNTWMDNWIPVFTQAREQKKLELMWDKVVCLLDEPFHGQIMKLQANPFVGR